MESALEEFAAPEERVSEMLEDGYTVIPGALSAEEVTRLSVAVDEVLRAHASRTREDPDRRRSQLYGIAALDSRLIEPLTLPSTLPIVCKFLGWNIHVHHSHLDISRPLPAGDDSHYRWHRDMQSTTYTLPPPLPLLSVKVGYFLTDASSPDGGSLRVIPGSHRTDKVERAEDFDQEQPKGVPVLASAGSAMLLDARTWHTVGKNYSQITRKMVYYAFTYRWIRPAEELSLSDGMAQSLSPVERQLLGAGTSAQGFHFPREDDVPLRKIVHASSLESFTLEASLTA